MDGSSPDRCKCLRNIVLSTIFKTAQESGRVGKPLLKQSSLDCIGIVRKNTWAGSCGGSRRFHGDRMKTRASKELEAISLVKRGFQKAWGLSPPSSPNLLSLVTPITSGAHSRRCAFPVHVVLPNRRRVTYSNLCTFNMCGGADPRLPIAILKRAAPRAEQTLPSEVLRPPGASTIANYLTAKS